MPKEITKESIERWLFKLFILAVFFSAGIGANALGYAVLWFTGAGAIFLMSGVLYIFNVGRLKIKASDSDKLVSSVWGRQFVNMIIMSFAFGSGVVAGFLDAGGLWRFAVGWAIGVFISWLYVKGMFQEIAKREPKPKKEKKEEKKKETE